MMVLDLLIEHSVSKSSSTFVSECKSVAKLLFQFFFSIPKLINFYDWDPSNKIANISKVC